jgi:glutathione S-transferase
MNKLMIFPHSHFCEKARRAMDRKNVLYQCVTLLSGVHVWSLRKLAKSSTLPVMVHGGDIIQGSSENTSFVDEHYPGNVIGFVNSQ